MNGSLRRLLDPDTILRGKMVELVSRGDFGPAFSQKSDRGYERVLFKEFTDPADAAFESGGFLLLKAMAMGLQAAAEPIPGGGAEPDPTPEPVPTPGSCPEPEPAPGSATKTFRIRGDVPPEIRNRLGTKILPKLRCG